MPFSAVNTCSPTDSVSPRVNFRWVGIASLCLLLSVGCTSLWKQPTEDEISEANLEKLMKVPDPPDLVREATISSGLHSIQVDGVGVVNQLSGTGGPADPSFYRDELIEEMKRHDIKDPNNFLEQPDNAMVRVRAVIPPGARRGDPIDIRVLAPQESQLSDLAGGWLLDTRLRRQIRLQRRLTQSAVHSGDVLAIGTGPVLTRRSHIPGEDNATRIEGNVIAGGRIQEARGLSLLLRPEYRHAEISAILSKAINNRFSFFDGTTRRGVANPLKDDLIEIDLHPRYRENPYRFMEVVRAVGVEPESSRTQQRLADLAERLSRPETAADAALQLEALGESAVPTLIDALSLGNAEIQFYASESLAYLDREESVEPLEVAARNEAAFRAPALMALQSLEHPSAIAALRRLLDSPSLETRYGAFCSLRRQPQARRQLGGQSLSKFWLYNLTSAAAPAIVVSLRESPELVVFGSGIEMRVERFLRGPSGIMIQAVRGSGGSPDGLRVSRFATGEEDRRAEADLSIESVIMALAEVDAGYGDVIEILRLAKEEGYLTGQLAIDPLPRSLRTYYRDDADEPEDDSNT